jgi:hypothetical protein
LDDMATSADLVASTQREEHELIRSIHGFLLLGGRVHGGMWAFSGHILRS